MLDYCRSMQSVVLHTSSLPLLKVNKSVLLWRLSIIAYFLQYRFIICQALLYSFLLKNTAVLGHVVASVTANVNIALSSRQ